MAMHPIHAAVSAALVLVGCSSGPRLQSSLPQIRDVPVLAGLGPQESLARARTYLASRQFGLAIELFKTASRDPALAADSLNGMAIAYDGIGRRDLAERYFQKALALRTDDGRTRRNLAAFYQASGQDEKRRSLLASSNERPVEAPVRSPVDTAVAGAAFALVESAPEQRLEMRSPLGGAFRPLLVKASSVLPHIKMLPERGADASIVCSAADAASFGTRPNSPIAIFRISIGEVFITTKPTGAACFVENAGFPSVPEQPISNKEYLGMVAAYLDHLNKFPKMAELSDPKRAFF